ncbi:MAG: glycosyltransferase [Phycisphaerales bacterium]|jgi:GT2 family glycosyltransferase|nr:glycosyltransferase [Phycisphaerales bacterium]
MIISYIIITHNRCQTLMTNLARLERQTPWGRDQWELFVVDNASTDQTAEAVESWFPTVNLIQRPSNEGMSARNHAIEVARGKYIVFLDDDSYPMGTALKDSVAYLDEHPKTAAVVGRVVLPNGECEAPAMPAVTLGGASMVRREVLKKVGGFATEFFRQAEEYDLSFRIWDAGYAIERFEDVLYGHDKVPASRSSDLTARMDLRNNLILARRYLPRQLGREYRHDWLRRYGALAMHEGHREAMMQAIAEARQMARSETSGGRRILKNKTIESIFELDRQAGLVKKWAAKQGIKRVAIAGMSKNLYATYQAAQRIGLEIAAIVESHPAHSGRSYRGLPIIPVVTIDKLGVQGVILSNVNPAQVDGRMKELSWCFRGPILRLWEPKYLRPASGAGDEPYSKVA